MTIIQLIFLIFCCNRSITAFPSNPNVLTVSRADSFSIYKKWELDTILGKEATMFGGIQHFQVLDLRDSTVLKMHPFGTNGPPTRYTIVGNEIVLLDKKGIPFKEQRQKKQSGVYILIIKDLRDTQLTISVNGEVGDSEGKRLMEFFQLVYVTKDK